MNNKNNRIKQLRLEKDISRKQLADEIGVSMSSIESYELGRRDPSLETFSKLSNFFGVSVPYLMGLQDSEFIVGDTDILTNMDESPNMMQNAILSDTQKAAVAFNRVLFWLDNDVLEENINRPSKNDDVRVAEKELINNIKSTFSDMRDNLMVGLDSSISENQKYIHILNGYKINFILMQKFSKLSDDDRTELLLHLKKIEFKQQNKKTSDD